MFEEAIKWGGVANAKNWDQALLAERRHKDMRGHGAGPSRSARISPASSAGAGSRATSSTEQVDGGDLRRMITEKGAPAL